MSATTLRLITGIVLIAHGIGYSLAFFPAFNIASTDKWDTHSWLLSGLLGDTLSRIVIVILFAIPMIGFIVAGLGVFNILIPHDWWPSLAIVSAIIGLIALALFWNAFPSLFPNKLGAIAVNLIVLWALLGTNALSEAAVRI
jgi:hypothetical protein